MKKLMRTFVLVFIVLVTSISLSTGPAAALSCHPEHSHYVYMLIESKYGEYHLDLQLCKNSPSETHECYRAQGMKSFDSAPGGRWLTGPIYFSTSLTMEQLITPREITVITDGKPGDHILVWMLNREENLGTAINGNIREYHGPGYQKGLAKKAEVKMSFGDIEWTKNNAGSPCRPPVADNVTDDVYG